MYGYCYEKIDVGHHWDLKGKPLHFGRSLAYELGARFSKGPVTFLAPNYIFKSKCKE